ncbi:hypothetical protein D3C77_763570 [compost metagenome]
MTSLAQLVRAQAEGVRLHPAAGGVHGRITDFSEHRLQARDGSPLLGDVLRHVAHFEVQVDVRGQFVHVRVLFQLQFSCNV